MKFERNCSLKNKLEGCIPEGKEDGAHMVPGSSPMLDEAVDCPSPRALPKLSQLLTFSPCPKSASQTEDLGFAVVSRGPSTKIQTKLTAAESLHI